MTGWRTWTVRAAHTGAIGVISYRWASSGNNAFSVAVGFLAVALAVTFLPERRKTQRAVTSQRFTAPAAGWYHYVSGRTPHLESGCTPACPMHPVHASKPSTTTVIERWEMEERDA